MALKNIIKYSPDKAMLEIAKNTRKEIKKEYRKTYERMLYLITNYPEVAEFKELYCKYIALENSMMSGLIR